MSKRTETDRFRSMVRVHVGFVPRAAQSPPQPRKSRPWSTAVSVIRCPGSNVHVQFAWQNSPPGPCTPAPPSGSNWVTETLSVLRVSKRTETVRLVVMARVQVRVLPPQSPPQESTPKPGSGVAVSVIRVPGLKVAVQVPGQLMPPLPVTLPLVGGITVSATVGDPKVADTVRLAVIVTVQGVPAAVPPQAPHQLSWTLGAVGWGVRVTRWPGSNVAVHVPGQLMPFGPVMVPLTGRWTVSTGRVTGRVTTRMVTDFFFDRLPGTVIYTLSLHVALASQGA